MKKRIISLIISIVLVLTTFSGCNQQAAVGTVNFNEKAVPQLVLAVNPILLFDDADTVIAFNDIKNAIVKDQKEDTISSFSDDTNWNWVYKKGDDWKKRKVYGLEKWRNGNTVSDSKFSAYTFSSQGSLSVMPIATSSAEIATYQDEELSKAVLALSVSGDEQEALSYQIKADGVMHIPENNITALSNLEGIKTEFLRKDCGRNAIVRYILNDRVIWSGQLSSNPNNYVTELTCPDLLDISVKAGDVFFISVELNTKYNNGLDEEPETDGDSDFEINDDDIINDTPDVDSGESEDTDIKLMTGYDSTYKIVYPENATTSQKDVITKLRVDMVKVFDADVLISTDKAKAVEYELLIGETNRPESKQVYKDLNSGRKNNASDFIIRVVNKKLVIAANTDFALNLATEYFMKNHCKSDIDKISSKLSFTYKPSLKDITIDNENISKYIIRTEKYPSILALRAAEELAEFIISQTGYNLKIVSSDAASKFEILVGLTTASGISSSVFKSSSLDNLKGYGVNDYKVYISNKKLFIEGGSSFASNLAVVKTIEALKKNNKLSKNFTLSGKYQSGDYSLTNGYAYTWGDEFLSADGSTINKKRWTFEAATKKGPWYEIDDPYYLASKKSLSDSDPSNDFGGPWSEKIYDEARGKWCVQEGMVQFGNKVNENYWIEDNALVLQAKRTAEGYTSINVQSKGLMEFRYGILEARVIMGTNNGTASTFWTRSRDGGAWTNEFDLCENFGIDKISPNMHTWAEGGAYHVDHGAQKQIQIREEMYPNKGEHFYDTYHYLTMEWSPEKVNFYLDGNLYLSQEITTDNWKAFAESTYLIFGCTAPSTNYNLWNGANNPGNYLMEQIGSYCENMYVDNVRIYQLNSRQYSLRAKK